MTDRGNRRPLASRDAAWARRLSRRLAATPVTPNQISVGGILAALAAGACLAGAGHAEGTFRGVLLVAGASFCQLRLLCNLLDGMVAMEKGCFARDGAFWNEFPDRVSDILILVGAGIAASEPILGWAAAGFALLTAYTRELGRTCGLRSDFSGPMAKQQRMAAITVATLVSALEPIWNGNDEVLVLTLWVVVIGAVATAARRAARIVLGLRAIEPEHIDAAREVPAPP